MSTELLESREPKVLWAQLHPSGGESWRPDLFLKSKHRLIVEGEGHGIRGNYWHSTVWKTMPLKTWIDCLQMASKAYKLNVDGILTHFPQLAFSAALNETLSRKHRLVCHNFNLGSVYNGLKRLVSRKVFGSVDRFIVHSKREIELYSDWLQLPKERFEFLHLQREPQTQAAVSIPSTPYFFAAGTANRDYQTLVQAATLIPSNVVIVAGRLHLEQLRNVPQNVEIRTNLSIGQCWNLLIHSKGQVVPLHSTETASGQVALVSGLVAGVPNIATNTTGTIDYIEHDKSGLLVPANDPESLAQAMMEIHDDSNLAVRLATGAKLFAERHLRDEAHFPKLIRVLDDVVSEFSQ
jgi:hypothetical protein